MAQRLRWTDLSPLDRALICSGCGGKGGLVPVPDFRFEASCNRHDFYYWRGGGELDRLRADQGFLQAMLRDAGESERLGRRILNRALAWTYYWAVRACGWRFFHYGEPRTSFDLLRLRMEGRG